MPPKASSRHTLFPVVRHRLDNGLRVVIAPDPTVPVVGVAVHYDVGFRSEPEGRTGFAHLFEHMMFQGSEAIAKMEHASLIQGAGGSFNGSTHPDYTQYFQVMPSSALEVALFLEADRMRSLRLTEENLTNQVAVVEQEINVNVLNQPYGGFPWIQLPAVLFETFPNAHNGYGDFSDLEAATLDDVQDFFERYYAPGNAVITVAGNTDPDHARALVERHFADVPPGTVPVRPSFAEPPLASSRRAVHHDPLAPEPAFALGWRVPDPVGNLDAYLPFVLVAGVLADGEASRLHRRLILHDRLVTSISAYLGVFGDPLDGRDPVAFQIRVFHPSEVPMDRALAALDEEIERLGQEGPTAEELAGVAAHDTAGLYGAADQLMGRVTTLGALELIHGRAELLDELPAMVETVSVGGAKDAAAALAQTPRAVLQLVPGAGDG